MNASGIRKGDIVEFNVRGSCGYAIVSEPIRDHPELHRRVLEVEPLPIGRSNLSYLPAKWITARQVVGHYARRGRSNGK